MKQMIYSAVRTQPEQLAVGNYKEPIIEKGRWGEMKYYWFTFSDGYSVCVKGFSKQELRIEENKHGRLLRKVEA